MKHVGTKIERDKLVIGAAIRRLGPLSRDCIRRGIFKSVPDLVNKIMSYVRLNNRNAQPFRWPYRDPPSTNSCVTYFSYRTRVSAFLPARTENIALECALLMTFRTSLSPIGRYQVHLLKF